MPDNERIIEEKYFEEVKDFIEKDSSRLRELIEKNRELVKKQGSKFNEDNPNGGMYSGVELTELHYEMENEMLRAEEAENDIYFYKKLIKEPYFARVDFTPDRSKRLQKIYIGLKTLQDPETYETYVCDWRAPISSLFYDDVIGQASFCAPAGEIKGFLSLKRQYKFSDGKLKYFSDSDMKIDDGILLEVLSNQKGNGGLKVIVNSIQKEQNNAIRYSEGKNLLVTGPAGSGKTSVGFHRLAYLLYKNRKELFSHEIVMFSNNDIFSGYVSDVIPELGETPVNYASFYSIFDAEIPHYDVGDYYELADELIKNNDKRALSVKIKYSEEFDASLKKAAENFMPEFRGIKLFNETVISGEQLLERFLSEKDISPVLRGERLIDYANSVIDSYFVIHKSEIYEEVGAETDIDEDTEKAVKYRRRILKQDAARMIKQSFDFKPELLYFDTLKKYADDNKEGNSVYTLFEDAFKNGKINFEDALCIVRLKQFLGTAAVIPSVKHILIDEAQDMSVLQHKIIKDMFPRAAYTLLADANQAILPEVNTVETEVLKKLYGAKELTLNKSYRSTAPVNRFAVSLLSEENAYEIFERDGEPVLKNASVSECLKRFAEKSDSIAIITKTAEEAKNLFEDLEEEFPGLCLCNGKSAEYSGKPCVMNLSLTKGLEFDSVIVYDKDGSFGENRFLYMAVTRALHRLAVADRI